MRAGLLVLLFLVCGAAFADLAETYPQAKEFFPQATRFGPLEGDPKAAAVYAGERRLGYVFLTDDAVRIPAYSGKPINSLVGIDNEGRITGVAIVEHAEPILAVGISEARLKAFADQYKGKSAFAEVVVGAGRPGAVAVDTISGATMTVMIENATVMRAARRIAEARGLGSPSRSQLTRSDEEPWVAAWHDGRFRIVVLGVGLGVLTLILVLQDWLARKPKFLGVLRRAFLLYTILFIGWYGLAQLSIVHVLTFVQAALRDFRWENFLIDPMLFILWSFVAVTLLLWGRGVFCGWLCPFGALQELIQELAQRLKLKQLEFPDVVHERLWAVKYVILLVLFGLSLQSMGDAVRAAEIEPFKTAVTLRFDREWPFVLYAVGLLAVSAFNRKFYCKYMCPLGAALTIPGRFRIFDWWLRRRKECGRPCQTCAHDCEVRAIRPTGEINANECHYCLDCQVTYYSDQRCMPLIERRQKREARAAARVIPIKPAEQGRHPGGV